MITTKSYSEDSRFLPAYLNALKLQFPFAIASGIIFIILLAVVFLAGTARQFDPELAPLFFKDYFKQGIYADMSQMVAASVILAILAFAATLTGMSYLHRKATVDLYHSLPVTRTQLLGANLAAILTAVLGPFIAVYLLTMAAQLVTCARYGCFGPDYFLFSLFDLASAVVYTAVVAVFAALIAVNVGTVFDTLSVSGTIGFTPPAVYLISGAIWQSLTYGAHFSPGADVLYLSPFLFMFRRYFYLEDNWSQIAGQIRDYTGNVWLLLMGIALAVVFFILAAVCYRRRRSEIAEQTQPQGVLQTVVRLVAAFVGGAMFYGIFSDYGFVTSVIVMFIGAVGIGLIAELILSRGVKCLGKNMKLLLGAGAVYCLLLILVNFDVFGYAARIPAAEAVTAVRVSYNGRFRDTDEHPDMYAASGKWLTEPGSIAAVREAHGLVVGNRPSRQYNDEAFNYGMFEIEYKLQNGAAMKRMYHPVHVEAYRKLAELEAQDDFIRANSALFWSQEHPDRPQAESVELYASFAGRNGRHINFLDDPQPLLDAIRADMLDQSLEDILSPGEPALGFITIRFKEMPHREGYGYSRASATVAVTREYRRTLALLKQMNLTGSFDDGPMRVDEVVKVGLVSTTDMYYDFSRVRTFSQLSRDSGDLPWNMWEQYGKDYDSTLILTRIDAQSIQAVAQASRDMLFTGSKGEWNDNYALAYFEMSDGSSATKAVCLNELPADIQAEVRKNRENRG